MEKPEIVRAFRHGGRSYDSGEEEDFAAVIKKNRALHDDLQQRELIAGEWEIEEPEEPEVLDGDAMSGNGLEAQLLRVLSDHVGQRGDSEGAVEVLNRIIRERDESAQRLDTAVREFETLQSRYESLQTSANGIQRERDGLIKDRDESNESLRVLKEATDETAKASLDAVQTAVDERNTAQTELATTKTELADVKAELEKLKVEAAKKK